MRKIRWEHTKIHPQNLISCRKHFPSYHTGERISQSIFLSVCEEFRGKTHNLAILTYYKPPKKRHQATVQYPAANLKPFQWKSITAKSCNISQDNYERGLWHHQYYVIAIMRNLFGEDDYVKEWMIVYTIKEREKIIHANLIY